MRVTVRGKRWNLVFRKMKDYDGFCESPNHPGKRILIDRSLGTQQKLDALIHELIHAGIYDLCEDAVSPLATDIAKIITHPKVMDELGLAMVDDDK